MIPFPKLHIAESTLNRVLNALENEKPFFPSITPAPIPPNPIGLSAEIDHKLAAPPAPAAPANVQGAQQGMVQETLMGGSPFDGALIGGM